jgi:hypothetical protein
LFVFDLTQPQQLKWRLSLLSEENSATLSTQTNLKYKKLWQELKYRKYNVGKYKYETISYCFLTAIVFYQKWLSLLSAHLFVCPLASYFLSSVCSSYCQFFLLLIIFLCFFFCCYFVVLFVCVLFLSFCVLPCVRLLLLSFLGFLCFDILSFKTRVASCGNGHGRGARLREVERRKEMPFVSLGQKVQKDSFEKQTNIFF